MGTNDHTKDINLINNIKNIATETNKKSPNIELCFSNIYNSQIKKNVEKVTHQRKLQA